MRPHSTQPRRTIYCVGPARLVKELSPLLENAARVRWTADLATLNRAIAADARTNANTIRSAPDACIVEDPDMDRLACMLETIRQHHPTLERLAIIDACNMQVLRRLIENGLTREVIYRPFTLAEVRHATGLPILPPAKPAHSSRSVASRG